jgi:hypothetical protein
VTSGIWDQVFDTRIPEGLRLMLLPRRSAREAGSLFRRAPEKTSAHGT